MTKQNNTARRLLMALATVVALHAEPAAAQATPDFKASNDDGVTLLYTITDPVAKEVAVWGEKVTGSTPQQYKGSLTLPASVEHDGVEYAVTAVADSAFFYCYELKEVSLPGSLKSIGTYAFAFCLALSEVEVPDGVDTIGYGAFGRVPNVAYDGTASGSPWGALAHNAYEKDDFFFADESMEVLLGARRSIISATIPSSVHKIGRYAFYNCTTLYQLSLSDGVDTIEEWAFARCLQLGGDLFIPSSVRYIGPSAFMQLASISSLTIDDAPAVVGRRAFYYSHFGTADLGNKLVSLGNNAFGGCTSLATVSAMPATMQMGDSVFEGCLALEEVSLPDGLTTLPDMTFMACTKLTSVQLPSSLTSIGRAAFWDCQRLERIVIPAGVASIGEYGFSTCTSLMDIQAKPEVPPTIASNTFSSCNISGISVTVPCGSEEAYRAAEGWSAFDDYATDCDGIDEVEDEGVRLWSDRTGLHYAEGPCEVEVYDLQGCLVARLRPGQEAQLETGVYIVAGSALSPRKVTVVR